MILRDKSAYRLQFSRSAVKTQSDKKNIDRFLTASELREMSSQYKYHKYVRTMNCLNIK